MSQKSNTPSGKKQKDKSSSLRSEKKELSSSSKSRSISKTQLSKSSFDPQCSKQQSSIPSTLSPSSGIRSSVGDHLSKSSPKARSTIVPAYSTNLKNLQRNIQGRSSSTTKTREKSKSESGKSGVRLGSRLRTDPRTMKRNDNIPMEASAENTFEQTPVQSSSVSSSTTPASTASPPQQATLDSSLTAEAIFNEDVLAEFKTNVMSCLAGRYCDPEQFLKPTPPASDGNFLTRHVDPEKLITLMVNHMRTYYNLSKDKDPFSSYRQEMDNALWDSLAFIIPMLCRQVIHVMQDEPMIITEIEPDVVVFGDIHGNFNDIYYIYENIISSAKYSNSRFLFLGDYVDRGPKPVEVCCFLFALKLSAPKRFYLLRGNHEILKINRKYGFQHMCSHLFHDTYVIKPSTLAELVYMSFNRAFCFMPVGAVIKASDSGGSSGKRIFCCHGGVPSYYKESARKGEGSSGKGSRRKCRGEEMEKGWSISSLNASLSKPASLAPSKRGTPAERAFNEIMWNDPLPSKLRKKSRYRKHKYYVNRKRGGHCNFFTESGLKAFLETNNLSMVVRGHQFRHTQRRGFQHDFNGALLTVFSSSNYCGSEKNNTGYVHVKGGTDVQVVAHTLRKANDAEKYRGFNLLKIVVDERTKAVTQVAF